MEHSGRFREHSNRFREHSGRFGEQFYVFIPGDLGNIQIALRNIRGEFGNIEMYLGYIWGVLGNIRGHLWNKRKEKVTRWRAVEVHQVQLPQTEILLSVFFRKEVHGLPI
jgi:hypothetical protein